MTISTMELTTALVTERPMPRGPPRVISPWWQETTPMSHGEDEALEHAVGHVFEIHRVPQSRQRTPETRWRWRRLAAATKPPPSQPTRMAKITSMGKRDRDGDQAGQHQVMDRVDVHRAQRVDFLVDAHRADLRRHGRADPPGNQDGHHHRRQLLGNGIPDHAANIAAQAALDQQRTGLQRDHPADEERQDADHQQAGVADLEELVEHLLALAPSQRQRQQRAPEQQRHLSYVLKHSGYPKQSFRFLAIPNATPPLPCTGPVTQ